MQTHSKSATLHITKNLLLLISLLLSIMLLSLAACTHEDNETCLKEDVAPESLINMTFKTSQHYYVATFKTDSTCIISNNTAAIEVVGTPTYKYEKTGKNEARLTIQYKEEPNTSGVKYTFSKVYSYNMTFTSANGGKASSTISIISNDKDDTQVIVNTLSRESFTLE